MGGVVKGNENLAGDREKGEAVSKRSIDGNLMRKKLADIGNLAQSNHDSRPQAIPLNTKEYIQKLHQENLSLVKVLTDRNKTIQLHALELQKLRTVSQELQQKNLQLAQTNSQLLAELNSSKERLKVLQHELGCNKIVRNLESKVDKIGKCFEADNKHNKPCNTKRKRWSKTVDSNTVNPIQVKEQSEKRNQSGRFEAEERVPTADASETSDNVSQILDEPTKSENRVDEKRRSSRSQSARFKAEVKESTALFETNDTLVPTFKSFQAEMKVEDKRLSSRQSARFKHQEQVQEPTGDLVQINDASTLVPPLHECGPTSSLEIKLETADSASGSKDQQLGRSSIRPKRHAAEKIQTYKEVPLNVKMRRTD